VAVSAAEQVAASRQGLTGSGEAFQKLLAAARGIVRRARDAETSVPMNLIQLLETDGGEIVAAAADALSLARLRHYVESEEVENLRRVSTLFALTLRCVRSRDLVPMLDHARAVARERFRDKFDLHEVQSAFNVLEEEIWKRITAKIPPADYPEAFGLASTVLGAGKEALAVEYVSLAGHQREDLSLDLSALFQGG
jgi:hypothetical protein